MRSKKPGYILSFALNLLVVVFLSLSMLRGYKISFKVKNNLTIFCLIPITLAIPYSANYLETYTEKYHAFIFLLCTVGIFNAFS
jgi:hypothetical protein